MSSATSQQDSVLFGKFYPLHRGHVLLIQRALEQTSGKVYVTVCGNLRRDLKLFFDSALPVFPDVNLRKAWIESEFAPAIAMGKLQVVILYEENIPSYPNGWKEWANIVRKQWNKLGINPTRVFTSEPQDAEPYKTYLDLETTFVDIARVNVHISGTELRRSFGPNILSCAPSVASYYGKNFYISESAPYSSFVSSHELPALVEMHLQQQTIANHQHLGYRQLLAPEFALQAAYVSIASDTPTQVVQDDSLPRVTVTTSATDASLALAQTDWSQITYHHHLTWEAVARNMRTQLDMDFNYIHARQAEYPPVMLFNPRITLLPQLELQGTALASELAYVQAQLNTYDKGVQLTHPEYMTYPQQLNQHLRSCPTTSPNVLGVNDQASEVLTPAQVNPNTLAVLSLANHYVEQAMNTMPECISNMLGTDEYETFIDEMYHRIYPE